MASALASVRQLLVISSFVIACILIGMLAMGTSLMERELETQLQADSENAVSTLALLVSVQPDEAARLRVLDAAFQQGRFATLVFHAPAGGEPLFEAARQRSGHLGVPGWFAALVDVGAHQARRQVDGLGTLALTLDERPAREALWTHVVQWVWLAFGIGAFWALFVLSLRSRLRRL